MARGANVRPRTAPSPNCYRARLDLGARGPLGQSWGHSWGFWVEGSLRRWLAKADPIVFTTVAGLAGFCAYFSMYAFRKPFAAASFDHIQGWHFVLDFKITIVIAQVMGYAASKFIGIKVIAEMRSAGRARDRKSVV